MSFYCFEITGWPRPHRLTQALVLTVSLACAGCSSTDAVTAGAPVTPVTPVTASLVTTSLVTATEGVLGTEPMADPAIDNQDNPTIGTGSVGNLDAPIGALEDGSTFDPLWRAEVTLGCGGDASTRTVESFDAETNDRGDPVLYRMWPNSSGSGGFNAEPATVGSVIPVENGLHWAVAGILLGPWEVDIVTDTCESS